MKAFINHISTISHQNTFRNSNWLNELTILDSSTEVVSPNYKDFIPVAALRRLSSILKSSITASIDCKENANSDFDAIIVGTGLGCLTDTEKFLQTVYQKNSDFISPTAFIQSTHNTIAGQISLHFKNHSYNITHTQNHLSFEHSLMDGLMCLSEGKKHVLVGAADEKIDFLDKLEEILIPSEYPYTNISSFFSLMPDSLGAKGCTILDVKINYRKEELEQSIHNFLALNQLQISQLDLILHSGKTIDTNGYQTQSFNYLTYSGTNLSASAFATHFANDYLLQHNLKYALVINTLYSDGIGMILIQQND
jgi:hypothetical protein